MHSGWYDRKRRRVRDLSGGDTRVFLDFEVRRVACRHGGAVKRERLSFLADNPLYTQRFAHYVGRQRTSATIKDVAQELRLDWHTVKALEKQYLAAQLARVGIPGPKAIGIDEISIRQGHTYRIVVSDLIRGRPIWFGGEDRPASSMAQFYDGLGENKARAPPAAILFDKFHVLRHLNEALDEVRQSEYARLSGQDRRYIKGQKYTRLSHRENLDLDGRQALKTLLAANQRLNTAYLRKRVLRATLELRARRLGTTLLRELARQSPVAALEALREVRRDDRSSWGWHRRLL